jgi:hypothetical protein
MCQSAASLMRILSRNKDGTSWLQKEIRLIFSSSWSKINRELSSNTKKKYKIAARRK